MFLLIGGLEGGMIFSLDLVILSQRKAWRAACGGEGGIKRLG